MKALGATRLWASLGRVPKEAWICALVACLNATCWSFITPPFQIPDEPDHYSYVEQLALTGEPPSSDDTGEYPRDEALALADLGVYRVRLQPEDRALFSTAQEQRLERDMQLVQTTPIQATGSGGVAAAEPPLYYALELIPYELGSGGGVLDRLELMRLLSAAMAGLTALFVFLFVREALPGLRWAWLVAGLAVALTPLLGFMSGGVTPEAMLYAVSAAAFFCLARAFRLGLTPKRGAVIAGVIAVGLLTKLNFVGFVPGMVFAFAVLVKRQRTLAPAAAHRAVGIAVATLAAFAAAALLSGALSSTQLDLPATTGQSLSQHGSLLGKVNYIWQFFLPRLPGMPNDFPGIFTPRQIWFNGLVGLYGWLDTTFPGWVYTLALLPAGALALLCIRALVLRRSALPSRSGELVSYLLMAAGLLVLVGWASYTGFPHFGGANAESRYLLPLLAPMGVGLALAARGAGRRWGPTVGALILLLFLAHDLFSQLQVISRYYG